MVLKKREKEAYIRVWMALPWGPDAPSEIEPPRSGRDSSGVGQSSPPSVGSVPAGFPSIPQTEEPFEEWREVVPSIRHKVEKSTDPNARRTRGFNAGQAGQKVVDQTHEKMWLDYYEATAGPRKQDINAKVTREIGATVRGKVHMIAPTFLELPPHEQYRVINGLSDHFNYDPADLNLKRWILDIAGGAYGDFKYEAHKAYLKWGASKIPEDFVHGRNSSWTYLCKHFESPEYVRRSKANKRNRGELKILHRTGPVPVAYIVQRLREDKTRYPLLKSYEQMYVKGATSGECFDNNEKIWAEVAKRLEAFKEANPEATDEEAENVVEADSVEILELAVGKRRGNEVRGMGRAGKVVASKASGSGSSRRHRGSSSAADSQSEDKVVQLEATVKEQAAVIKKQKSKLSKIGKKMKCLACLIPKILSATGVEHEGVQEIFRDDDDEDDDEEDDDDEDDDEEDHDLQAALSASYSQVGPAHSRPSGSGGMVMIPTPGLQPTPPPPPSGKGKGKADH